MEGNKRSSISTLWAITIGVGVIIVVGVGLFGLPAFYNHRIPESIPMSLGTVDLYSNNSTFSFQVYNPKSNAETGVTSVVINGSSCSSTAWNPIRPDLGNSITFTSESCLSSHIISGQQYSFKVSFSNGVSISGLVNATQIADSGLSGH